MKRSVDNDTKEIIESFVAEGYERLDDAEAKLGRLGGSEDAEIFNAVFRLFHSVKGSAGFLEFDRIKALTHEAEALLEVFIRERIPYTQEALDVVYQTIDLLRTFITAVEREYTDQNCCEEFEVQVGRIRDTVSGLHGEFRAESNVICLNDLVTRDMAERFIAESADLVERVERDALDLENNADKAESVHSMFRAIHTIKGNSGFFGYGPLEKKCKDLESLLDSARRGDIPSNAAFVNGVLANIDVLRALMVSVTYQGEGVPPGGEVEQSRGSPPAKVGEYRPLGEILIDLGAAPEAAVRRALETQEKPVGRLLVEEGVIKSEDLEKALEIQRSLKGAEQVPGEDVGRREIRVDTSKLDKLFDLVGELITAEAMVYNSPDLAGLPLDSFNKAFNSLTKISRELQGTAMMIRMIPLEGLFHKMSRLVRDLSRKFGKDVELRVHGEETEMDKNVIEQISDPLVHILRNALDHGIESPEARKRVGKNGTGNLSLEARYEGSEIWICIKDDGAGLDREKILAKAMEKGLLQGDPASIPDREVWRCIFEPGFSTADVVSEVSGRGVGMDVVKRNLEKIRGRVDVRTERGKGTEFVLQIPLTMAILDGITVRVGQSYYSVPLSDILEFFKARREQITRTEKGQETVNLRGSVMPLLKLGEIFRVPGAGVDPTEGIILVVRSAGRNACLLIDEVVGNQQIVIKALSEYIGKVEGLSGCSILGDGTVSFIIDTGRLLGLRLE